MRFKLTNKQVKEQFTNIKSTGYYIPYNERCNKVNELLKEFCILNGGY